MKPTQTKLKALLLAKPKLWVATAESLTSGRVQALIGEIAGASDFFRGGLTAYSLQQKTKHLGVKTAAARKVNSVSAAVAEQMAAGACRLFKADLAVATTGYAQPSPEHKVEIPYAYWAVAYQPRRGPITFRNGRIECPQGGRVAVQTKVAAAAFRALLDRVAEIRAAPAGSR